jgi:CubicO group peptidase (beta-lactamase class C family)
MREADIPGLSIALIRNRKVVWEEGFGVINTITGKPVTPETLFEIASNSKVITAYAALRLVDQGKLDLDRAANSYLTEPYLSPSEYSDKITIRHLLSHSSGLPHTPFNKNIRFEPGTAYSYSGIGFEYLQKIIEQITGQSLEEVAQELVFKPLSMTSSTFRVRPEFLSRTANGHIRSIVPLLGFAIPYTSIFIIVFLIGLVVVRITRGSWRPTWKFMACISIIALALLLLPTYFVFRSLIPEFWWLMVLCTSLFILAWTVMFIIGRRIIQRILELAEKKKFQMGTEIAWGLLILAGLMLFSKSLTNVPTPRWPAVRVHAAGTMRTTVGDLAKFLLEIAEPKYLSEEMALQLQTPQISPSQDLSWGLGPGIQHSREGDAIWQWGQTLDFQSVMVIYPEYDFGAVVFTNSDFFHPLIVFDVAHRALGGHFDGIMRAARLEFNR